MLRDVPDSALIMHEEPFGPVVPLTVFDEFDEAIPRANSLPLAAYIFTHDSSTATRASLQTPRRIRSSVKLRIDVGFDACRA